MGAHCPWRVVPSGTPREEWRATTLRYPKGVDLYCSQAVTRPVQSDALTVLGFGKRPRGKRVRVRGPWSPGHGLRSTQHRHQRRNRGGWIYCPGGTLGSADHRRLDEPGEIVCAGFSARQLRHDVDLRGRAGHRVLRQFYLRTFQLILDTKNGISWNRPFSGSGRL